MTLMRTEKPLSPCEWTPDGHASPLADKRVSTSSPGVQLTTAITPPAGFTWLVLENATLTVNPWAAGGLVLRFLTNVVFCR